MLLDRPYENYGCGALAYGLLVHISDWPNAPIDKWKARSTQDVACGRGYSKRVCKTPVERIKYLREISFEGGHHEFLRDTHLLYYGTANINSQ